METYKRSTIDPRAFVILDDCLYDKNLLNDENIRTCFMNKRHLNIFFFINLLNLNKAPNSKIFI
mgnify:CR=1 FL=1